MIIPRAEHIHAMRILFGYPQANFKFSIKYDTDKPDFSMHKIKEYNWFLLYGDFREEMPHNMIESKGKPVII